MPIGFNGQSYDSEFELMYNSAQSPQEPSKESQATPVPNSENNASTGSVNSLNGIPEGVEDPIPEDITRITVRPQPDYVNPPENTPSFRPTISGMVKGLYDSIKTWGDAIQGKVPTWAIDEETGEYHTNPQVIEKSLDLAGLAVMGPAPVAGKLADGTLGSFAGVRSATLDKTKLYKAQNMALEGAHPDDIWKETGFFRGADDRWKYEIPNDMSNLKTSGTEVIAPPKADPNSPKGWEFADDSVPGTGKIRIKRSDTNLTPDEIINLPPKDFERVLNGGQRLEDVLHNPELFKAYPFLKDLEVRHMPFENGLKGQFSPSNNTIYMAPSKADNFLSTLQHEVQHAIQTHEGFAGGGNTSMFSTPEFLNKKAIFEQSMDRTISRLKDIHPDFDFDSLLGSIQTKLNGNYEIAGKSVQKSIDFHIHNAKKLGIYDVIEKYAVAAKKIDDLERINYQKYRRLMGEVESRNVQARLDFDNTERFLKSPRSTEDIPRFLQKDPGDVSTFANSASGDLGVFPKGYYDRVTLEQRLSRSGTEPSHPGFRWEVYDPKTGKIMRKDIMSRSGASKTADNLDNKYGAYRYRVRAVKANKLTEKEQQFINSNTDLFTQLGDVSTFSSSDNVISLRPEIKDPFVSGKVTKPYSPRWPNNDNSDPLKTMFDKKLKKLSNEEQAIQKKFDELSELGNKLREKNGWNDINLKKFNKLSKELNPDHVDLK